MAAIPTIEIHRGERHLIVNACDLPTWEAAGWSEVAAHVPQPPPPPQEPEAKPHGGKRKL